MTATPLAWGVVALLPSFFASTTKVVTKYGAHLAFRKRNTSLDYQNSFGCAGRNSLPFSL